jgi:hypothetical protein
MKQDEKCAAGKQQILSDLLRHSVTQKALGDFAVNYEINVPCGNAQAMGIVYTRLHRNVLDLFNEYGVQIMTPAYEGDPKKPKLVPKEQWFAAPANGAEPVTG